MSETIEFAFSCRSPFAWIAAHSPVRDARTIRKRSHVEIATAILPAASEVAERTAAANELSCHVTDWLNDHAPQLVAP